MSHLDQHIAVQLHIGRGHFEENPSGMHNSHPALQIALSFTLTGFGRFLSIRFIRKNTNPYLTAFLQSSRQKDSAGFDLLGRNPSGFQDFYSQISETNPVSPQRQTLSLAPLLLAVLHFFREK